MNDCMVFNAVFNSISVILKWPKHLTMLSWSSFNPLAHNKILDLTQLRAFANDNINATGKLKFVLDWLEKIVEKGESASYQHFLLLPQCFPKASSSRSLKVRILW